MLEDAEVRGFGTCWVLWVADLGLIVGWPLNPLNIFVNMILLNPIREI